MASDSLDGCSNDTQIVFKLTGITSNIYDSSTGVVIAGVGVVDGIVGNDDVIVALVDVADIDEGVILG